MAKAREVDGIEPGASFAQAAARVVAVRGRELLDHRENVLDTDDIERVHAMRVASRRLRAVLEIFAPAFEPELHAQVLREVKRIADALGERRDPDVQLDHLAGLRERLAPGDRAGVDAMAAVLRVRQQRGNAVLARALERLEEQDLGSRLDALARTADPDLDPGPAA